MNNIFTITYRPFSGSMPRTCTIVCSTVDQAIVGARKHSNKQNGARKPFIDSVVKTGDVDRVER